MTTPTTTPIRLAILVTGSGTNCENIIRYFAPRPDVQIPIVVSSRPDAYALTRAQRLGIPTAVITRQQLNDDPDLVLRTLHGCHYIILAGFLPKIPPYLISQYPNRIINIHPALLPRHGGKGMWGHHVHEAVKASGDTQSGITIHYVNAELDQGQHIAQFSTPILPTDTPDDIAQKVHTLEMAHYPQVIDHLITHTPLTAPLS